MTNLYVGKLEGKQTGNPMHRIFELVSGRTRGKRVALPMSLLITSSPNPGTQTFEFVYRVRLG